MSKIVVKIGSALLVNKDTKSFRREWLNTVAQDIKRLGASGHEVVLVSSGAIALARAYFGSEDNTLPNKQALSTYGQPILMAEYNFAFDKQSVSQLLLTREDLKNRARRNNILQTISALKDMGILPVVNENDAVATEEIKFGDNDQLAALFAKAINADELIILTRTDGLYTGDPETDPDAKHIPMVEGKISRLFKSYALGTTNADSTGGMESKIKAAEIALKAGVKVTIASGIEDFTISRIQSSSVLKTVFQPA